MTNEEAVIKALQTWGKKGECFFDSTDVKRYRVGEWTGSDWICYGRLNSWYEAFASADSKTLMCVYCRETKENCKGGPFADLSSHEFMAATNTGKARRDNQ